jgi:redox-sensitive bicupin YhaK (pirin superfamily)
MTSTHPHRDAEIFTYILDGNLTHQDSMGSKEALPRGCVQYMSAGTGVTHSVSLTSWHGSVATAQRPGGLAVTGVGFISSSWPAS